MGNNLKYDAFISYRHSELDKFVAVNLHKKLEAFKLPKGVKSPTGKKRIERVFRDQDELPLSSNLSDPINLALENSEFLLVICTPRLPESEWCKREIETFIRLHGRDRVLAVLAEGEPEESFPEALTREEYEVINPDGSKEIKFRTFEPLAADVRGKNPREIKKAMNDAVLRISAAMFSLNYDEIKQRHKERAMKRTLSVVSAVAAALMLFSAVCLGLMFKIINQSEMILDQNDEIKKQYSEIQAQSTQIKEQKNQLEDQFKEAQINLAEATTVTADNLVNEGRSIDAIYALRRVMPESSNDDSYPYTAEAEYALTNALELYSDYNYLFYEKTFDSESAIETVKASFDYNKVATLDSCNNLHVWDAISGKELFTKSLTLDYSADKNKCLSFIDSDTLLYRDGDKLFVHNIKDNTEKELPNPDGSEKFQGKIYRFLDPGRFVIFTTTSFYVYDSGTLNCICAHELEEISEGLEYPTVDNLLLSEDQNTLICSLRTSFPSYLCMLLLDIESDSLQIIEFPAEHNADIDCMMMTEDEIFYTQSLSDDFVNFENYICCMDRQSKKIKWKKQTAAILTDMVLSSDSDCIIASAEDSVYVLDAQNGELLKNYNAHSKILNIFSNDINGATVLTSEGIKYAFSDSSYLYTTYFFASPPDLEVKKYVIGYGKVFVQFSDASYVSFYQYRDFVGDPLMECAYSLTMDINKNNQFIRNTDDIRKVEMYSLDSKDPIISVDTQYSNNILVGDGCDFFANYGLGLTIYNVKDGSVVKDIPSLDVPDFNEAAVTNDAKYIYSGIDREGHIFLYSLTTGEIEDIFKPDIPTDEHPQVYGLDRDYYAVKRDNGNLEIYKGKNMKPFYTVSRQLSNKDAFKVFRNSNVFSIAYTDGTIEFYRFGENIEPVLTHTFISSAVASFDRLQYYPEKNIYIMQINSKTLVLNEDLEVTTYIPFLADYVPSENILLFHRLSSLYSMKRYTYDDLIYESNKKLNGYVPSDAIIKKYNLPK